MIYFSSWFWRVSVHHGRESMVKLMVGLGRGEEDVAIAADKQAESPVRTNIRYHLQRTASAELFPPASTSGRSHGLPK